MPTRPCFPTAKARHRITLQTKTTTATSYSDAGAETWADTATVWAAIEPATGREFNMAAQTMSDVTHTVTIRHRAGVTRNMRVQYGTRTFAIKAVLNPDEANVILRLLCSERDPEASE